MNKIALVLAAAGIWCMSSCTDYSNLIGDCGDGILNLNEEEVDCGGVCDPCTSHCSNGVQDEDEIGVDCGGSCGFCPPPCQPTENTVVFSNSSLTWTVNGADYDHAFDDMDILTNHEDVVVTFQDSHDPWSNPLGIYYVGPGANQTYEDNEVDIYLETWPNYDYANDGQQIFIYLDSADVRNVVMCNLEFESGVVVTLHAEME